MAQRDKERTGGDRDGNEPDPSAAIVGRTGNQVTGTDEEQPASGLRPSLEPDDRDPEADGGHRGDGGGVGKSL